MLNVSQDFKDAINRDSRSVKAMVAVTFDERINMDNVTASATTYASEETHPNKVINGRFNESDFIVTGDAPDRLKSVQYGWQSAREINPDGTIKLLEDNQVQTLSANDFRNGKLTDLEVVNNALRLKVDDGSIVDDFTGPIKTFKIISGAWDIRMLNGNNVFTHPIVGDSSLIECVIEFSVSEPSIAYIDWGVSSEYRFDKFEISQGASILVNTSGEETGTLKILLDPNSPTRLTLKYYKDSGSYRGMDRAWLSKVEIKPIQVISDIDFSTVTSVADFSNPNWQLAYVAKANKQVYRANTITHDQSTVNIYTFTLDSPATILYKVGASSEQFYDYFDVYVDDELRSSLSGEMYKVEIVDLQPGTHTLKFVYRKDGSVDSGLDTGWIEFIRIIAIGRSDGGIAATQGHCILEIATPSMEGAIDEVKLNFTDSENAPYLVDLKVSLDDGQSWKTVRRDGVVPFDYSQPWPATFKLKITLYHSSAAPPIWAPLEPGLIIPITREYEKEATQLLSLEIYYHSSIAIEELEVDYGAKIRTNNLWLVTGNTCKIEDFSIQIYDPDTNNWSILETVTGNTQRIWSNYYYNTLKFQKIKLIINKVAPGTSRIVVLQFGAVAQLVFEGDDIVDLEILEELIAEGSAQLGSVIANECALTLRNDHRWFTPVNNESPLAGLLKPKRLIEPYLGVEIASNRYEFIPMGKFRSTDWNAPSSGVEVSLTGYDRMIELNEMEIPLIPVIKNVTIKDLFTTLFQKIGLSPTEYLIDQSLTQPIPIGWIPNGKVRDALPVLAEAGNCTVTIDRYDRIIVRSNFQNVNKPTEAKFTDNDHIIEIDNPQRLLDIYTHVKVSYKIPSLKNVQEILTIQDLSLPPGRTDLKNLQFQEAPVAIVTSVQLLESTKCSVIGFKYGAWGMDISLQNNSNSLETVQLIVYGKPINLISSSQIVSNHEILMDGVTEKYYEIDNPLIQSQNVAKVYSRAILEYLVDPRGNFKMTVRGNPALEPRDIIEVESIADKIPLSRVSITRNKIRFDGGLEVEIDGRKPAVPSYWVFINPGFPAKVYQQVNDDIYTKP